MTDTTANPMRRRATIFVDADRLVRMLDLPDGCTVMGVNSDWPRSGVTVMIQHDALPPVDPACEPPMLDGAWEYDGETGRLRFVAADLPDADHPHADPGDGRKECWRCGKFVFEAVHSCKGVPVTEAAMRRWRIRRGQESCCEHHTMTCEPPSELCCHDCPEVAHGMFPIPHADGSRCVLDTVKEGK